MNAKASNVGGAGSKTPRHLWIVGVIALLWSMVGAFDYLATQLELESYMSQFTQEQLDYFYGFPKWATSVWAIAVWGSVVGSVGLLLRRRGQDSGREHQRDGDLEDRGVHPQVVLAGGDDQVRDKKLIHTHSL